MALGGVWRDELMLRAADQAQLVLVLAKMHDRVPLQDQHLGHQQPQLPISHHSYLVSCCQHLMQAQPDGCFVLRQKAATASGLSKQLACLPISWLYTNLAAGEAMQCYVAQEAASLPDEGPVHERGDSEVN